VVAETPVNPGGGGGGWGGGGGGGWVVLPPVVTPPVVVPPTNPKPSITDNTGTNPHPDEDSSQNISPVPGAQAAFWDFKDYMVSHDFIAKRISDSEYEYQKFAPRKELLGVAVKIALNGKDTIQIKPSKTHFKDIGKKWQAEWISQTVDKGITLGIISTDNVLFRPDADVTRAEAFAMLMKWVCMDPSQSNYSTWEQRVYDVAQKNGITVKSWTEFKPQEPILRQELFVIATRLDAWRNTTGGCSTHTITTTPKNSSTNSIPPTTSSITPVSPVSDTVSGEQQPGTFAFLYETETEKVYSYVVKNWWIPDGVRLHYVKVFGGGKNMWRKITVGDADGNEFLEKQVFTPGEMVYVSVKK